MAENYTIKAVKPEPKSWKSQYGPMVTYTVLFEGRDIPAEINKKEESPAPKAGDEVYGNITRTEYGDKFKSEQKPFSGGGGGGRASSFTPKQSQDQFTMYLSYAKDIAVAMLEKGKLDEAAYGAVLDAVSAGGQTLYESREGASVSVSADTSEETKEDLLKNIDEVFGTSKDKEEEAPWPIPD